jgi:pimeloyl-ACP methyl ester carboxylesterase
VITQQPKSLTVQAGQPTTFTVVVSGGTGPFSYQWVKDGLNLGSPTSSNMYTIASVQASDAGNYGVIVSYPGGSLGSRPATLAVGNPARIVLLLHGMNSNPLAWNNFVTSRAATLGEIWTGVLPTIAPVPDSKGVMYYAINFGAFDYNFGRPGLDGCTAATDPNREPDNPSIIDTRGDYSTFDQLGTEVDQAIVGLLNRFPSAQIFLVGHSRGGLAARAFLQNQSFSNVSNSVVALLTIGTPHIGSPLGRIYEFLTNNPRSSGETSWDAVDFLRNSLLVEIMGSALDVRKPTIGDLAASYTRQGLPIIQLNQNISKLPTNIPYGVITSDGVALGDVSSGYDIFPSINPLHQLSALAEDFLLDTGTTHPLATYHGDGVVALSSQYMNNIAGFPVMTEWEHPLNGVRHTDETDQVSDIFQILQVMISWWK